MRSGTLFCEIKQRWAIGEIRVKLDTIGEDFVELNLNEIQARDSTEWFETLEEMADQGSSCPIDLDTTCRNGLFDEGALFMIYEADDLQRLISRLTNLAVSASV